MSTADDPRRDLPGRRGFPRDVLTPLQAPAELIGRAAARDVPARWPHPRVRHRVKDLWKQNFIYGLAHSYVCAEAIAVGACAALRPAISSPAPTAGTATPSPRAATQEDDGRADGQGRRLLQWQGRLHAHRRRRRGHARRHRHRRQRHADRRRGRAHGQDARASDYVTVCFHGDGGTNQGVWHESINLAAVWNLPVIFLCENNQWAISLPYDQAAQEPQGVRSGRGLRHPGRDRRRLQPLRGLRGGEGGGRAGPGGRRPHAHRGPVLPLHRPFCRRRRALPRHPYNEPWKRFDPLARMARYLVDSGSATEAEDRGGRRRAAGERSRKRSSSPRRRRSRTPDTLYEGLYSPEFMEARGSTRWHRNPPAMPSQRRRHDHQAGHQRGPVRGDAAAIRPSSSWAATSGIRGNPFGVTKGLYDEFGAAARARHADLRGRHHRHLPGRRRHGPAPDRRDPVLRLDHHRHGPAGQPGRQDPLHVRRATSTCRWSSAPRSAPAAARPPSTRSRSSPGSATCPGLQVVMPITPV